MPPFLLDISVPSLAWDHCFGKQCGLLCPHLWWQRRKKKHLLGFKHLTLPLVEDSLAQEVEPSESLADPRGPRCVDLKLRQVNSSLTSLFTNSSAIFLFPLNSLTEELKDGGVVAACQTEGPTSVTILFSFPWSGEFLILVGQFPFAVLTFE